MGLHDLIEFGSVMAWTGFWVDLHGEIGVCGVAGFAEVREK